MPYPNFTESAAALDYRRLGKQVTECVQILNALHEISKGWANHPVTNMWRGHELALCGYAFACEEEWEKRGYKVRADVVKLEQHQDWAASGDMENMEMPPWFGEPRVHMSYQQLLLMKDYEFYSKKFPGVRAFTDPSEFVYPV
jgi:hypothetical protein